MKKTSKKFYIIAGIVVIMAIVYITFLHSRVQILNQIRIIHKECAAPFGEPALPYDKYTVTDPNLVTVEFENYSIGLPSTFEDQSKEEFTSVIYRPVGTTEEEIFDCEVIGFTPVGKDGSDSVLLNLSEISNSDKEIIKKECEEMGYGMPDTYYGTLKAGFSLTSTDYNFLDYEKSLAYMYLLPSRLMYHHYYSDGERAQTYIYETESKFAFINIVQPDESERYSVHIMLFEPENLNTYYTFTMELNDVNTAYAILNSIEFRE